MNLPEFNTLLDNQSTYITFSKALLDYDIAINNKTEYYFSKMVALNLPSYKNPDFYIDLSSIGISQDNIKGPNYMIPKGFQYYMENIIRQVTNTEYITELAFYKFLNKCGLSYDDIQKSIVFINGINTENFTYVENNNGWGEIVMQIPNNSKSLNKAFKSVDINDLIIADINNGNGTGLFDDTNEKSFVFNNDPKAKDVIDFDNITYNETENTSFDFNVLLVFYKDKDGIEKLHGINFINNFENKITEWILPKYTQKTNDARSIGYIFKLNIKTVNNEASLIMIEEQNSGPAHWETYFTTINKFNEFLELHKNNLL